MLQNAAVQKHMGGSHHRWLVWLCWICSLTYYYWIFTLKNLLYYSAILANRSMYFWKCNYNVCHLILELLESFENTKLSGVSQILCCNNRRFLWFSTKHLLYSWSLGRLWFGVNLGNLIFLSGKPPSIQHWERDKAVAGCSTGLWGDTTPAVRAEDLQDAEACFLRSTHSASRCRLV